MQKTTFEELYQPLILFFAEKSELIDELSGSRRLFFIDFVKILLFHFIYKIDSLRSLVTELATNSVCVELGLPQVAFSTLKDGFTRFKSIHFKQLYQNLLAQGLLETVPDLEEYGLCHAVDGSLFPSLITASWASYKKKKKAIRLHVEFSLNQMVPIALEALAGNSCERSFLKNRLQAGITYLADRGYFSFDLGNHILKASAHLVFRIKSNLLYTCSIEQPIKEQLATCFSNVSDQIIQFTNDPHQNTYRLICFDVEQSHFRILTNRVDLSISRIIILYAYRWQIELLFKFIKRTLKGIHLLNQTPNGSTIQFYILMIVALLQLRLKQKCIKEHMKNNGSNDNIQLVVEHQKVNDKNKKQTKKTNRQANWKYFRPTTKPKAYDEYKGSQASTWIKMLATVFEQLWKISKQWTIKLKNLMNKPFDQKVMAILSSA